MSRTAPAARLCTSFPAQVGRGCRVLILGSMPGERSLAAGQYYAHPRNLFWRFMGALVGAGPELPYRQRLARLQASGLGLWDVLEHCERPGSLDGRIVAASEVPNDLAGLLARHRTIVALAFNGAKAAQAFARRIEPTLGESLHARVTLYVLPSTSPANASITTADKFARWRVAVSHECAQRMKNGGPEPAV